MTKKNTKTALLILKTDSGLTVELPMKYIYDDLQKLPVIQYAGQPEEWKAYPVQELETYIDSVQTYLDAQAKRTYVAPAAPTTEEKEGSEQTPTLSERVSALEDTVNTLMKWVDTTNG